MARVSRAAVRVDDAVVGAIEGPGLLVLLGVHRDDPVAAAAVMARKLHELRILDGERSAVDEGAPVLVVSQFTLFGDCRKGRRPSFTDAAPPELAERLYNQFVARLRSLGVEVATGVFRAHMDVALVNDGPVTLWIDTEELRSASVTAAD